MIFKPKILKVLQSVLITLVALICALSINTLHTQASESGTDAVASSIVDSLGITGTGGDDTIKHGVWHTKTGYLCYLLNKNGQKVPGTNAIALSSPGFYQHDGTQWIAESRKGGYTADNFSGTAKWNCTPWQESNNGVCATNEPTIRAWFEKEVDGVQNAFHFVDTNWGNVDPNIPHKFGQGEYYLVIETLMHFQYSVKAGSTDGMQEAIDAAYAEVDKMSDAQLMYRFKLAGFPAIYETWLKLTDTVQRARADIHRTDLKHSVKKKIEEAYGSGGRTFVGDPVIGTVPNLIEYKHAIGTSTTVFNSFTNKVACFAEYIQPGNIGEQIGFKAWTGGTSSQISDSEVFNHGVAMMVISAKPQGQTTADESKIPTPHAPAKESDGTYSIVKSYRTKQSNNTLKDDGTFSIQNISNEIQIESEQKYQVVGWKVTSTASTSVDSINWNPPGSTQAQGTTASTVTIQDPYKCLYVLLEKTEETPEPPAEPYNYKLTESSITRRVHFTAPDHRLTLPYIENHTFKWIIPAHQTSCPGNHPFTDACHGQHVEPHTASCPTACSSTCTEEHTHSDGCSDPHYYDCGTRCQTQYASCSGWQWHEKQLKLSINNTQQSNYPDILATKSGWNTEHRTPSSLSTTISTMLPLREHPHPLNPTVSPTGIMSQSFFEAKTNSP